MFNHVFALTDMGLEGYLETLTEMLHKNEQSIMIFNPVIINDSDEDVFFDFKTPTNTIKFIKRPNRSLCNVIYLTRELSSSIFAQYYSQGNVDGNNNIVSLEDIFILNPGISTLTKEHDEPSIILDEVERNQFNELYKHHAIFKSTYLFYIRRKKIIGQKDISTTMGFISHDGLPLLLITSFEDYKKHVK